MSQDQSTDTGWIKASVTPPKPGFIVKRWNSGGKVRLWAGYYSGDAKLASCDEWKVLEM